jgi:di/tricarboxylate transporter
MEIAIVLSLLALAIIAFSTEKISVDIVAMICVITLVVTGILTAKEAFAPFGSDFLIMLASIFVVSSAIDSSGILEALSAQLLRMNKTGRRRLVLPIMTITAFLSAFMNNTTVTALMINPAMAIARKSRLSFSRVLMPVAFASIVGGTCTLIGTSTNIAVNAYLEKNGYPTLGMFDFTVLGVIMVVITLLFFAVIGHRMLPKRGNQELTNNYGIRSYLSEIQVLENSALINQVVHKSDLAKMGFEILGIMRDGRQFSPGPNITFEAGDQVLVKGLVKNLMEVRNTKDISIMADGLDFYSKRNETLKLREIVLPGRSDLAGSTISEIDFRRKYSMLVVAVNREGKQIINTLRDFKLEVGDMLLVQGTEEAFANLKSHHDMVVLGEHEPVVRNLKKGYLTIALFLIAIILASFEIISTGIAFLSAAVMAMLTKAIKPEDAYKTIEWRLLVLIAGMTAFGTAMTNTGADKFLADLVVKICEPIGNNGIFLGFMILTVILTQPMSNAAAALVVLPVALKAAETVHVNPMTFAVGVMLSASVSLVTPFEPSCILVYGPGKYKFVDFVKLGGIITILLMIVIYFGVPLLWPM